MKQLSRMVVMMMSEKSGCTRMWMATLRTGENGEITQRASVAEKRKMSFPLLTTMKVCVGRKKKMLIYQAQSVLVFPLSPLRKW